MASVQVRIDDLTKKEAEKILNDLGMTLGDATRIFFKQIVQDQALPFQPHLNPSKEIRNK